MQFGGKKALQIALGCPVQFPVAQFFPPNCTLIHAITYTNRMTVSDYSTKPVHDDCAILFCTGSDLKLYTSDCLGWVEASHDVK